MREGILHRLSQAAVRLFERRLSIGLRLTVWFTLLLIAVLALFSTYVYLTLERTGRASVANLVEGHARQVAGLVEVENGRLKMKEPIHLSPPGTYFALYDADGRWLAGQTLSGVLPAQLHPRAVPAEPLLREAGGVEWYVAILPVTENDVTVGWVGTARSAHAVEETSHRFLLLFLVAVLPVLVIGVLGGLTIARRALSPIDRITRTARAIGQGNLSARVHVPATEDEVQRLAQTFNEMLGRLEDAFERQRRFTADASHELRTPIAVVAAQAEDALHAQGLTNEVRSALETIQAEAERMAKLVSQLLFLARSDAGRLPLEYEKLDLSELVRDVAAELAGDAAAKGLALTVDVPPELPVWGDQTQLTRLFINLVDNAIKYTYTAHGRVKIEAVPAGEGVRVTVADTGSGIPPEDLPRIFERFYRVDKARSRLHGGTGLGLAIAHWIVSAHGGRIEVASEVGQGTTFTVFLPRRPS